MLRSIFYARFHSERGPVVLRQYPRHSIFAPHHGTGNSTNDDERLIHFSDISSYIIPAYELCNQALSLSTNGYSILGWPISIEDQKYPRNRFTFNVCFVLEDGLATESRAAWDLIVKKTARWFQSIEDEAGLLLAVNEDNNIIPTNSIDGSDDNTDVVARILEEVYTQLYTYHECCVAISDAHVLNLRYEPRKRPLTRTINLWDVPLLIKALPDIQHAERGLVLQRIHKHINGINHVRRIAELTSVDLDMVLSCLQLLHVNDMLILLDIFHFQAAYATTEDMTWFIKDKVLISECRSYITKPSYPMLSTDDIIELYLYLTPNMTLADFGAAQQHRLLHVDIRRFVTFGVIKGLLRRVHKFARAINPDFTVDKRPVHSFLSPYENAVKNFEHAWKQAALSSGWATPPADLPASLKVRAHKSAQEKRKEQDEKLKQYLNGQCCFDQICVEMSMTYLQVMEKLGNGQYGSIAFFSK